MSKPDFKALLKEFHDLENKLRQQLQKSRDRTVFLSQSSSLSSNADRQCSRRAKPHVDSHALNDRAKPQNLRFIQPFRFQGFQRAIEPLQRFFNALQPVIHR
jgi:hypothetical protein